MIADNESSAFRIRHRRWCNYWNEQQGLSSLYLGNQSTTPVTATPVPSNAPLTTPLVTCFRHVVHNSLQSPPPSSTLNFGCRSCPSPSSPRLISNLPLHRNSKFLPLPVLAIKLHIKQLVDHTYLHKKETSDSFHWKNRVVVNSHSTYQTAPAHHKSFSHSPTRTPMTSYTSRPSGPKSMPFQANSFFATTRYNAPCKTNTGSLISLQRSWWHPCYVNSLPVWIQL